MTINLYEDAQGKLYLHQEGSAIAWCVRPGARTSFLEDASRVASGRTADWEYPQVEWDAVEPKEAESRLVHVACWSSPDNWQVVGNPDSTARAYMHVERAQQPPPPEPPHTVHQAHQAALGSPEA
ncbi:MAG TPA: hypothetical protein VFU88_21895 [Ktedonobacterales bacterium]|nr:hypothetical protein [Ktedonobacterales bacterium]